MANLKRFWKPDVARQATAQLEGKRTSPLRQHASGVRPGSFPPFVWADVLSGRSDKVLFEKGWLDTCASAETLRQTHAVKDKANRCGGEAVASLDVSRCLRE